MTWLDRLRLLVDARSVWPGRDRNEATRLRIAAVLGQQGVRIDGVELVPQESALAGRLDLASRDALGVLRTGEQPESWQVDRHLFDRGFVPLGTFRQRRDHVTVFLRSALVRDVSALGGTRRGVITMARLGTQGRFGNQLFQYMFVKLYALRHGLRLVIPRWDGTDIFKVERPLRSPRLPTVKFRGNDPGHLEFWDRPDVPIDVNFEGFFQELPPCWGPHRQLVRQLFSLDPAVRAPIDAWWHAATDGSARPLVAVHLRRGDYLASTSPRFRAIPEDWYQDWLDRLLPTLRNPVVFVATDDPAAVLPHFERYRALSGCDLPRIGGMPLHVLEFDALRRAAHLAICNSSYSRMAAILALDAQQAACPSVELGAFAPYDAWADRSFWSRFAK